MKTKAVRIYGKKDLRLEEFELPPIKDDEILARIVSDSICMSSYKASMQGADHSGYPKTLILIPQSWVMNSQVSFLKWVKNGNISFIRGRNSQSSQPWLIWGLWMLLVIRTVLSGAMRQT